MRLLMDLSGTEQRPEDRNGFRFRGGHVALDLAATLSGRYKREPRELLETPADLDRWLVSSGLIERRPGAGGEAVELARELREAIYAIASGASDGGTRVARERLNAIAALPAA